MISHVAGLLERGRAAAPHVSALDAVMGEDWAVVSAGRARQVRQVQVPALLKIAHRRDVARMGGGVPGRKPQAVLKMVRKGGAADTRGLRAQMAYLSRNGAQPIRRSDAFMGIEVDAAQMAAVETSWRMPPEGAGRADRTSHFIASFPKDTARDAAERTGRAWAEEMFGSGRFGGDSYDYYTAFHTDRAHPHMHVVVYRRGLEQGAWLKVSQRSDTNYDAMRAVLVEVAALEGIDLDATPRLARGIHDRPVPDREYRQAAKEGRTPAAPGHTRETATLAAAALLHQSRRFAIEAQLVEDRAPDVARILYAASAAASEGRALAGITDQISNRQETDMSARVDAAKTEIRDNIARMDQGVHNIADAPTRMQLVRQIAALKQESAPLLGHPDDLAPFGQPGESGRYRGVAVTARRVADDRVRTVAIRYGVDAEATIERYAGPAPSKGLERQFARAEAEERAQSLAARGTAPEDARTGQGALTRMHGEIAAIYAAVRTQVRDDAQPAPGRSDRETEHRAGAADAATARDAQAERARQQAQSGARADSADARRDEAKRQQDRENAERARRERDNGRGL